MATSSKIEWTDATWNPVAGCTWASPGCDHCYAATMTRRLEAMGQADYSGLTTRKHFNGVVRPLPHKLDVPLKRKKPTKYFVNSMSDLFHKDVPFDFIDQVFGVMAKAYWHSFQVLTKRPERMAEYLSHTKGPGNVLVRIINAAQQHPWPKWQYRDVNNGGGWNGWPYKNIILGASVDNQETADARAEAMQQVHSTGFTTFVSYEPALGPVNWHRWFFLDWMIAGGESGPHARPSHPDWFRSARDFCGAHSIPFFFKQWGEYGAGSVNDVTGEAVFRKFATQQQWVNKVSTWVNGGICIDANGRECNRGSDFDAARYPVTVMHRLGKKTTGRTLDGATHDAFPALT